MTYKTIVAVLSAAEDAVSRAKSAEVEQARQLRRGELERQQLELQAEAKELTRGQADFRKARAVFDAIWNTEREAETLNEKRLCLAERSAKAAATIADLEDKLELLQVAEHLVDGASDFRTPGKHQQTRGVIAEAELARGAHHAVRFHAANFRLLDLEVTWQHRARERHGNAVADVAIRRAAHDLLRSAVGRDAHRANRELVRVGMLRAREDFTHDQVRNRGQPGLFHALNLEPEKRKRARDLVHGGRELDVGFEPGEGDFHEKEEARSEKREVRSCYGLRFMALMYA